MSLLKILIVDDTDDDAFFTGRLLQAAGLPPPFTIATGGPQAIDVLSADPTFDLVLLDVRMPQYDGFAVLAWIRERPALAHLRVVMLTTSGEESDLARARHSGADGYFAKYPPPARFAAELAAIVPRLALAGAAG